MEDKNYRFEDLKEQLRVAEMNGERTKKWRLKSWQVEYIEQCGYRVVPYIYSFKTREFKSIRDKPNIIKDIHYASKRGKKVMCKPLTDKEMRILENFGIKFRPDRFIIYLNKSKT